MDDVKSGIRLIQRADESLGHCKEGPRLLIERGLGAHVFSAQANSKFLDFTGSSGVLGYSNDSLNQEISKQIQKGICLPGHSYAELDAAEKTKEVFPFIDHVKFFRKEFDAVTFCFELLRESGQVLDPVFVSPGDNTREEINELRDKCTKHSRVMVLNEGNSAFRFPKFSASSHYGVTPDLIIIGAKSACGMPFFILGGKSGILAYDTPMPEDYPVDCLSLGAYTSAVKLLQTRYSLDQLWENSLVFQREFNRLSQSIQLVGNYPTRLSPLGKHKDVIRFIKECENAGFILDDFNHFTFPLALEWKSAIPIFRSILLRAFK